MTENVIKNEAILLRQQGWSYSMITKKLGVAKTTLNYWFRNIVLSKETIGIIENRKRDNIRELRKSALVINRQNYEKRLNIIFASADEAVGFLKFNPETYELMLAMLYLCEGSKKIHNVEFSNSNPEIIRLYLYLLRNIFDIQNTDVSVYLHLRADQDIDLEIKYWSKICHIGIRQFRKSQLDRRTLGKKTWVGYHGVCTIRALNTEKGRWVRDYSNLIIQRLLRFS
jgi:hypothetical protein